MCHGPCKGLGVGTGGSFLPEGSASNGLHGAGSCLQPACVFGPGYGHVHTGLSCLSAPRSPDSALGWGACAEQGVTPSLGLIYMQFAHGPRPHARMCTTPPPTQIWAGTCPAPPPTLQDLPAAPSSLPNSSPPHGASSTPLCPLQDLFCAPQTRTCRELLSGLSRCIHGRVLVCGWQRVDSG